MYINWLNNLIDSRLKHGDKTKLAKKMGIDDTKLWRIQTRKRKISVEEIQRAADYFNVEFPRSEVPIPLREDKEDVKSAVLYPPVKIYGQVVAGVHGEFEMNGQETEEVERPVLLHGIADAYGVVVSGDSMLPKYEDGAKVFVDPTKRPRSGSFVVVQIKSAGAAPHAYVKKFVSHTQQELILEQLNVPDGGEKLIKFPHEDVESVHKIVMSHEAD